MTLLTLAIVAVLPALGLLTGIHLERNRNNRMTDRRRAYRHQLQQGENN